MELFYLKVFFSDIGNVFIGVIKSVTALDSSNEFFNIKVSALQKDLIEANAHRTQYQKFPFPGAMVPVTVQKVRSVSFIVS